MEILQSVLRQYEAYTHNNVTSHLILITWPNLCSNLQSFYHSVLLSVLLD